MIVKNPGGGGGGTGDFGRKAGAGGANESLKDNIIGSYYNCPEVCTATGIVAEINCGGFDRKIKAAIYKESDDSFVVASNEQTLNHNGYQWITFPLSAALTNQNYYLVVWSNSWANLNSTWIGGAAAGVHDDGEVYNGFPDPWVPGVDDANRESHIYCTYTTGGGGGGGNVNHRITGVK